MTPYQDIEKANSKLKQYKWIGGWEDGNKVFLYRRENGERKVLEVPYVSRYFCITKEDFKKLPRTKWEQYKQEGWFKKGYFNGEYAYIISDYIGNKILWNNWLKILHDLGVEPLEADISRLQRLVIDLDLNIVSPLDDNHPKVCFFDIETDDSGDKINAGVDAILSVAIKDYYTGDEFFYINNGKDAENEREFLLNILKVFSEYDVRIGYNNFAFDDLVIDEKIKKYRLDYKTWKRQCSIDMFNQFERQYTFKEYKSKSKKLDDIARIVIGSGKTELSEKINVLWETNKTLLREYNLQDIRLLYDMEKKLNTCLLVMNTMSFAGIPYNVSHSPLRLVESFLLKKAVEKRKLGILDFRYNTSYYLPEHNLNNDFSPFSRNSLASDRRKGRKEALEEMGIEYEEVEGAYIMESKPGFFNNVAAFDFESLYPNTMRAFNICHSTLLEHNLDIVHNCTPDGTCFRTDYLGILPDAINYLLSERKKLKQKMNLEMDEKTKIGLYISQYALKVLANTFFGITAQWGSRFYSQEIGNAVTSLGRYALPMGEQYFNALDRTVVVQDTDSMYLVLKDGDNPETLKDGFLKILYSNLIEKYNIYRPEVLVLAFEKLFKSLLIIKKKMYAGMASDGEIIIKGLKLKKSDTSAWSAGIAQTILEDILKNKYPVDHFVRILETSKNRIIDGEVSIPQLLLSSRLGKEFGEYSNDNLVYVRIAQRMIEQGLAVTSHATINYIVTDGTTPMQGLGDDEINKTCVIDAVYYYNNQLLKIVTPMLEIVFPEYSWDSLAFPKKLKRTGYFELKVKVNR